MAGWILAALIPPLAAGHLITSPARLEVKPTAYPGIAVGSNVRYGAIPGHQLWGRDDVSVDKCDGQVHGFECNTGTCYTGTNGIVGCCSVSSCAPRTTCIEYDAHATSTCDMNTGGCLSCTDPGAPYCATITNVENGQYIHWCDAHATTVTTSYSNPVTGSIAGKGGQTSTTSESSSSSTTSSVSTATVATSTSSSIGSTVEDPESNYKQSDTTGRSFSSEAVGGIAGGAVAGVALLVGGLVWYFRRRLFSSSKHGTDSSNFNNDKGTQPSQDDTATRSSDSFKGDEAPADLPLQLPSNTLYSPESLAHLHGHPERPNATALSTCEKDASPQRYTVTNPDPQSPYQAYRPFAPRAGTVEAPTDRPISHANSHMVSPIVGSSNRNSNATSAGFPSPLTARESSATFTASPSAISSAGQPAYTPSNYQVQPPDSVANPGAQQPPSLPQEYSTADMAFQGGSPVYRGLRSERDSDVPPWAYLSAEDARKGMWENDSPTRAQHRPSKEQQ